MRVFPFASSILFYIATCNLCAGVYSGGNGTEADPYKINTKTDWQELMTASMDLNKYFILTSDIDLTGVTVTPVAPDTSGACYYQGPAFTGVFDGNNHVVRNVSINLPSTSYVGIFGYVGNSGIIKNLTAENVQIIGFDYVGGLTGCHGGSIDSCRTSGTASGHTYVGGIAGYSTGGLNNCSTSNSVRGYYGIGGVVGYNDSGSVNGCYATGSVNGSSQVVGGLVGWNNNNGSVTSCYAIGLVNGSGLVGGLIGLNSSCNVISSYATGSVSGSQEIGGLIGWNDGGSIRNSNASGAVNGTYWVGGLAGYNANNGSISVCFATGQVNGDSAVGGLLGANLSGGTVHSCYAMGSVLGNKTTGGLLGSNDPGCSVTSCYATGSATGDNFVGGLLGWNNQGKVIHCYSTGKPTGSANVGGLCGITTPGGNYEDTGNFWDKQTSQLSTSKMGLSKTTAQMKTESTFIASGWDFSATDRDPADWQMPSNDYPRLAWETISSDAAIPTFSPDGGAYTSGQNVMIACATSGATIHYTTNGLDPTETDPFVDNGGSVAVSVDPATTLKARAFKAGLNPSEVKTAAYTLFVSSLTIQKCSVTAGKNRGIDRISFSSILNARETDLLSAMNLFVSIVANDMAQSQNFTFPINNTTLKKGKFSSKTANASFALDTKTGKMSFSAKNVDLTGLACPVTVTITIGDYKAELKLDEAVVNGTKPCPLPLMQGVKNSLDITKSKFKKGKTGGTDSLTVSGTFTVAGEYKKAPLAIMVGSQTFTVDISNMGDKNNVASCSAKSTGGITAKLDYTKCTFTISIKNANITQGGTVNFGINCFVVELEGLATVKIN